MDQHLTEPWIEALVAKIPFNCYEDEIDQTNIAWLLSFSASDITDEMHVGGTGMMTDGDIIINAIFSKECFAAYEEEEDTDFYKDLQNSVIILKKYKVRPMLETNVSESVFVLYINEIALWYMKEEKKCSNNPSKIMDVPRIKNRMTTLWRRRQGQKNTTCEFSFSENTVEQSQLSGVIKLTEKLYDDKIVLSYTEENNSESEQSTELSSDVCSGALTPDPTEDQLDYADFEIPQDMLEELNNIEEWKEDYCPPSPELVNSNTSSESASRENPEESLCSGSGLMSFSQASDPAEFLESCHLAMLTQLSSDQSSLLKSSNSSSSQLIEDWCWSPDNTTEGDEVSQSEIPTPLAQSTQMTQDVGSERADGNGTQSSSEMVKSSNLSSFSENSTSSTQETQQGTVRVTRRQSLLGNTPRSIPPVQVKLRKLTPEDIAKYSPKAHRDRLDKVRSNGCTNSSKRKLQNSFEEMEDTGVSKAGITSIATRSSSSAILEDKQTLGSDSQNGDITAPQVSKDTVISSGTASSSSESNRVKISVRSPDNESSIQPSGSLPPYQPPREPADEDYFEIQQKLVNLTLDLDWLKTYYHELEDE